MFGNVALALLLALIPPSGPAPAATASPALQPPPAAASPAPEGLKTIVTVLSSPYCNALATHFNGAMVPLVANDRTLDGVSVQLDDLNTLFSQPNYVQRFLEVRDHLGKQVDALNGSLHAIQDQINALRGGEHFTTDAQAASQIHLAAQNLQTAYDKQRQLSIDLMGMYEAMMRYNIERANPPLGGFSEAEMREPEAMRDVKDYLHFNGQRDAIAVSEDRAVDVAYAAATQRCMKQPAPSASP